MRIAIFVFAAIIGLLPTTAESIDSSDIAAYNVLDKDGKPTSKVFRLARAEERWRIEDRQADGQWQDITCEGGCILEVSKKSDLKRFFPADDISKITMSCLHNLAFAFCRYARNLVKGERGYVFIALTEKYPIPLRVQRVKHDA